MMFHVVFSCSCTCHLVVLLDLWCIIFLIFRKISAIDLFIYYSFLFLFSTITYIFTVFPQIIQAVLLLLFTFFFHIIPYSFTAVFPSSLLFSSRHAVTNIQCTFHLRHHMFEICSCFPLLKHIEYSYN